MPYQMTFPWGQFQGHRLTAVPGSYLVTLLEKRDWPFREYRLRDAVAEELRRRINAIVPNNAEEDIDEEEDDGPDIKAVLRSAALRFHPDRGGSRDAMTAVNWINEQVRALGTK
jgi:hypothetical protein